MPADHPEEDYGGLDAAFGERFVELWRANEGRLRDAVEQFGALEASDDADAEPLDIDDVLSEVAFVMLRVRLERDDDASFLWTSRRIAQWLILDRRRRESRRRRIFRDKGVPSLPVADADSVDAQDAALMRLTIQQQLSQAFDSLSRNDRRAVVLFLRGGPFTGAERVTMHRARERLAALLRDALAIIPARLIQRVRCRIGRVSECPAMAPAVAALASAVALGAFPQLAAAPVPLGPARSSAARDGGPPITVSYNGEAATTRVPETARVSYRSTNASSANAITPVPERSPVTATATANLPTPATPGRLSITVGREYPAGQTTIYVDNMRCDSQLKQRICRAVGAP
jgi:DNA-directed RNA polymerase specialized sigma24 family protein